MTFFQTFKKSFDFSGRATRKEFWEFFFGVIFIALILSAYDGMIGTYDPNSGYGMISVLFGLLFTPTTPNARFF